MVIVHPNKSELATGNHRVQDGDLASRIAYQYEKSFLGEFLMFRLLLIVVIIAIFVAPSAFTQAQIDDDYRTIYVFSWHPDSDLLAIGYNQYSYPQKMDHKLSSSEL